MSSAPSSPSQTPSRPLPAAAPPAEAHAAPVSTAATDEAVLVEQMEQWGVTQSDVARVAHMLKVGSLKLKDVVGLSSAEMQAMSYRAYEVLKAGDAKRALRIYMGLYELDRFDPSYTRGAAMCFHVMKKWGFAYGFYKFSLATAKSKGGDDFACRSLGAECLLWLEGKDSALRALAEALANKTGKPEDEVYVQRAEQFRAQLAAMG